ncbi:MAG: YraN family protein [Rickettsiella sp.]|nr:YraN family protein [Rickettsiella sp.]
MISAITSKKIGAQAENFACHYLKTQGLSLIIRNYICRFGEIDLIMQDKNTLIFIEVRYRSDASFGHSLETVHKTKQKKLIKTADYYLQAHPLSSSANDAYRFDVVAFSSLPNRAKQRWFANKSTSKYCHAKVEWIKNAFSR